jgi:hypothetical protein
MVKRCDRRFSKPKRSSEWSPSTVSLPPSFDASEVQWLVLTNSPPTFLRAEQIVSGGRRRLPQEAKASRRKILAEENTGGRNVPQKAKAARQTMQPKRTPIIHTPSQNWSRPHEVVPRHDPHDRISNLGITYLNIRAPLIQNVQPCLRKAVALWAPKTRLPSQSRHRWDRIRGHRF